MAHAFFVLANGFVYFDRDGAPSAILLPADVLKHVKDGTLIPPSRAELKDRSKGDGISKAFAIIQTLWFVIQCSARRLEHLPMTQLEVMTLAYTAVTVAIFASWWHKPLNIACPIQVPTKVEEEGLTPSPWQGRGAGGPTAVASIAFAIFGTIHCAAWSYSFPTHTEMMLWRLSALTVLCLPLLGMAWGVSQEIFSIDFDDWHWIPSALYMIICGLSVLAYIAGRLILFGLSFSTLRLLSEEMYHTVRWTQLIPHF